MNKLHKSISGILTHVEKIKIPSTTHNIFFKTVPVAAQLHIFFVNPKEEDNPHYHLSL